MYTYELPTTGAVSFSNFCVDQTRDRAYTHHIPEATQARANLRGLLKDSKRTEGEKDYLALVKVQHPSSKSYECTKSVQVIDEYLPYLQGLITCVAHDEIGAKDEPSAHIFVIFPLHWLKMYQLSAGGQR